jgi:glucose-6-phosphate isomerase
VITLDTRNTSSFISDNELTRGLTAARDALRSLLMKKGPGRDMLGWLELPRLPEREIGILNDTAKRIQDENDCLVVIGIGGSYLGARAAIEALPEHAEFPVLFAGNNLSPEYHARLLESLAEKRFSLCVISKSGTTTEPAVAFRLLRKLLHENLGREAARSRIIAVTDSAKGALRKMAAEEGYTAFPIPSDVGGRFSVLSPVGLLPIAVSGIPIPEMLRGAASSLGKYTSEETSNDALRYAVTRALLHAKSITTEVLSTFHPELFQLCEWWKQLAGESEGKDGKGLFPASTVMTTDLHSLGQYLQEGVRNILETFLVVAAPRCDIEVPADESDLDGLNYLAGRPMGEINRKAYEGTIAAHTAGGLPTISMEIDSRNPHAIGELFVFFEIAIAVSGRLLGVNPFDQPGVEEYKKRMFELLGKPGVR